MSITSRRRQRRSRRAVAPAEPDPRLANDRSLCPQLSAASTPSSEVRPGVAEPVVVPGAAPRRLSQASAAHAVIASRQRGRLALRHAVTPSGSTATSAWVTAARSRVRTRTGGVRGRRGRAAGTVRATAMWHEGVGGRPVGRVGRRPRSPTVGARQHRHALLGGQALRRDERAGARPAGSARPGCADAAVLAGAASAARPCGMRCRTPPGWSRWTASRAGRDLRGLGGHVLAARPAGTRAGSRAGRRGVGAVLRPPARRAGPSGRRPHAPRALAAGGVRTAGSGLPHRPGCRAAGAHGGADGLTPAYREEQLAGGRSCIAGDLEPCRGAGPRRSSTARPGGRPRFRPSTATERPVPSPGSTPPCSKGSCSIPACWPRPSRPRPSASTSCWATSGTGPGVRRRGRRVGDGRTRGNSGWACTEADYAFAFVTGSVGGSSDPTRSRTRPRGAGSPPL
jgi:hypothetical protein